MTHLAHTLACAVPGCGTRLRTDQPPVCWSCRSTLPDGGTRYLAAWDQWQDAELTAGARPDADAIALVEAAVALYQAHERAVVRQIGKGAA